MTSKGWKWLGDGTAFIEGVPPRDLTPDEVDVLDPYKRHSALKSGLYEELTVKETKAVIAKAEHVAADDVGKDS